MLTQHNNYEYSDTLSLCLCVCLMQEGLEASPALSQEKEVLIALPVGACCSGVRRGAEVCTDVDTYITCFYNGLD